MLRTLVKDSAIYAVGTIASRLVGFIMIPVYTRVLTPADYGVIDAISRVVDMVGLLLALGLAESLMRHYFLAKDEEDRRRLVASVSTLNVMLMIAGSLVIVPLAPYIARLAFGHDRYATYVAVSLIAMLVGNLVELPFTLWRAEGKAWLFTGISLAKLLTHLLSNIVLVVWLQMGVWGVVLSGLITASFWSIALGFGVRQRYGVLLDWGWLKPVLKYGVPLVPAALSQFILHSSDRFFLTRYATEGELGVYSLAYRFATLATVFFGILARSWWPWVFRVAQEDKGDEHLRKGSALVLLFAAVLCSGIILATPPLIRLMAAPPFWSASQMVPLLTLAYWFFISTSALRIGSLISSHTISFASANILSAVVCLVLNAVLINRYSVWGAVYATLGSFVIFSLSVWFYAHRVLPLRHDVTAFAIALGIMLVSSWWSNSVHLVVWLDISARFAVWLALTVVASSYFVRVYRVRIPVSELMCRVRAL